MYEVALLIERQLEPIDADQVIALHDGLDEAVAYRILLPVENSTAVMASSLASLGGEIMPVTTGADLTEISEEIARLGEDELQASVALLRARGAEASGSVTEDDPIEALAALVAECGAAEAIVLTEPHMVAEFLHLDWTSRARRRLNVPTLHLLEHIPFEGQR